MTDENEKAEGDENDTIVRAALDLYDAWMQREQDNISEAYDDLEFRAGKQWRDEDRKLREEEGRPCETVNVIPQYVRQVTGDMRQMKPAIKVLPVDDNGDKEVAKEIEGVVRYVENRSDAPGVYFQGADSQVTCGVGAWRVTTEYAAEGTFSQEIRIEPIDDALSVAFDLDAKLPTREDGMETLVTYLMSRRKFEKEYPDATASDFAPGGEGSLGHHDWSTADMVRIGEYWYKKKTKRVLAQKSDGGIEDVTDDPDLAAAYKMAGLTVERRDGHKVYRVLVTAREVIDGPKEWPGSYIPIIPVIGEEVRIKGRVVRHGMVRFAKDAQRELNYMVSAESEVIALQPKSPFLGTEKNFEEYEEEWDQANRVNYSKLTFKPDPMNGGIAPQRVQPAVASQGIIEGIARAERHLQSVIGIYNASIGAKSNESSGVAVNARDRQSDTGTYVYIDNWGRAIRHTGKVVVDLIPHIYDTARILRIIGDDGNMEEVKINQLGGMAPDGSPVLANDVTTGAYDVSIQMGPSYATKREEARQGMTDFVRAAPAVAPLILDLVAKSQDWHLADEISERIELTLPPEIRAQKAEKEGKPLPPQEPPKPSPEEMATQAKLQLSQQEAQASLQLKQAEFGLRQQEAQADIEAARVKAESEMQIKREQAALDMQLQRERMAFEMQMQREKTSADIELKQAVAASQAEISARQAASQPRPDQ